MQGGISIFDVKAGKMLGSVTLSGFRYLHGIAWHPRLDRLALLERAVGERWVIWVATPDGSEARPVYSDQHRINSICWSPTENVVYFLRTQNDVTELLALDVREVTAPMPQVLISGLPAGLPPGHPSGGSLTIAADGRSLLHIRGSMSREPRAGSISTRPSGPLELITRGHSGDSGRPPCRPTDSG